MHVFTMYTCRYAKARWHLIGENYARVAQCGCIERRKQKAKTRRLACHGNTHTCLDRVMDEVWVERNVVGCCQESRHAYIYSSRPTPGIRIGAQKAHEPTSCFAFSPLLVALLSLLGEHFWYRLLAIIAPKDLLTLFPRG